MQQAKFEAAHRGMTSIAKKVFAATPEDSPMNAQQIYGELRRTVGGSDVRTTAGCLGSLADAGLVMEPRQGYFVRTKIRPKFEPPQLVIDHHHGAEEMTHHTAALPDVVAVVVVEPPKSAVNRLGMLAAAAFQMSAELRTLADDIEIAALEVAEQQEANDADSDKLRQLKSILKSLG